jgi:hypothetical protein
MLADASTENSVTGVVGSGADIGWGAVSGRSQIVDTRTLIRRGKTDQRRHTIYTCRFEDQSPTTARLCTYIVVLASKNGETHVATAGRYSTEAVKESDGVWTMSRLDAVLDSRFRKA